jgi:hypothetical protein
MVILAALPGIVREPLVTGRIVNPGNFGATVNLMGFQLRKVGLGGAMANHPERKDAFCEIRHQLSMKGVDPLRVEELAGKFEGDHPNNLTSEKAWSVVDMLEEVAASTTKKVTKNASQDALIKVKAQLDSVRAQLDSVIPTVLAEIDGSEVSPSSTN